MDKTAIYILAVVVGAVLGIISMVLNKNKKTNNPSGSPEKIPPRYSKQDVKEFAQHHYNEIKKLNPNATLDSIPDNIFPEDLKAVLRESTPAESDIANRVTFKGNDIFITNNAQTTYQDIEIRPVLQFKSNTPVITVYENGYPYRSFMIEPKTGNENLGGQYFHASVRVNANSSVQIDGIISKTETGGYDENNYEGIRFQPFFLSDKNDRNKALEGKGMFQRGLHYSGLISSGNIRLICICDSCLQSFSVEFIHTGFSDVQYFYSENSMETLFVRNGAELPEFEHVKFRYYNAFKCPNCGSNYIDFENNKEIRPGEYYANYYLNQQPLYYKI